MIETLVKTSESDRPIALRIEDMERVAAEVFAVSGGVGFADIGWNSPYLGGNSFHVIKGQLVKCDERSWDFIDEYGREVSFWLMDEYDDLLEDWIVWQKVRHEQGRPYNREEARTTLNMLAED
jgi:hypothetical protein